MSLRGDGKVAVITGASSGIGAAAAKAMASAGFTVVLGARREERLEALASEIEQETGRRPYTGSLDVTSLESSTKFVSDVMNTFKTVNILLNNAGLASGTSYIETAEDETDWQKMIDTNVSGLLRMTRLFLPHIIASGEGHVINLGSIAGHEAYAGGSVYAGTKFAVRAITTALRQELLGKPVRVTHIAPGMVETEFSVVRYHGDENQAANVYTGMTPLTAEDIADCIVFAVTRPLHVNIDEIIVKPTDQAGAGKVARR
ncbi:SDR family NAD(P)-dependent oxidoreductase [Alicyclobacillus ferrooxydans]|uniref:Short-chain dehydrogenase n=1 Tax=Alicyclobacillus ferrooxydans TaxID=471514 RepID=A0A0P9D1H7_9BACL|nr:SDR family NAD(P)-dependent oxidoreductase [Alicyclobacillus ferrooxydans]KPV43358.1 short-chain dehydrogenase [Alicyclobacillus ferrooxydans]